MASSSSVAQRARTDTKQDDQDSLFDRIIEDDLLAATLDKREAARVKAAKAKGEYEDLRDTAKGKIDALGLEPGETARCGRFRIKKGPVGEPTEVAFTKNPKPRLTITLIAD